MLHSDDLLKVLAKKWLGTLIRSLLVGIGAWIKASGKFPFIDSDVVNQAISYAPDLAGDVLLAAGIGWSAVQKWLDTKRLGHALNLPAGSSVADLAAK